MVFSVYVGRHYHGYYCKRVSLVTYMMHDVRCEGVTLTRQWFEGHYDNPVISASHRITWLSFLRSANATAREARRALLACNLQLCGGESGESPTHPHLDEGVERCSDIIHLQTRAVDEEDPRRAYAQWPSRGEGEVLRPASHQHLLLLLTFSLTHAYPAVTRVCTFPASLHYSLDAAPLLPYHLIETSHTAQHSTASAHHGA